MNQLSPITEDRHVRALIEAGVKFCFSAYVDLHGRPKGKCVPIGHADQMLLGSELYTGAALDGVPQDVSDDEVAAMPDASRFCNCSRKMPKR